MVSDVPEVNHVVSTPVFSDDTYRWNRSSNPGGQVPVIERFIFKGETWRLGWLFICRFGLPVRLEDGLPDYSERKM